MSYLSVTFSVTGASTSRTVVCKAFDGASQVSGRLVWECWAASANGGRPTTAANTVLGNGTGAQTWFSYATGKFIEFRGSTDGHVRLQLVCTGAAGTTRYVGVLVDGVYAQTAAIVF